MKARDITGGEVCTERPAAGDMARFYVSLIPAVNFRALEVSYCIAALPQAAKSMANTKKIKAKGPKVVGLDGVEPPQTQATEADVPAEFQETEPAQDPLPRKAGRPPGRPVKKSFWESVQEIEDADWKAKRFYLYAYLIEPFCNVKTEGEPGYLRKFYQSVDPEFFLNEWGSGKYFLRLKEKPPGQPKDRDVDMLTFEIMNPSHPPKLPRALWEKDSRNARWLTMLPKEQKPTSEADTMKMLETMFDMQNRIEDRIRGQEPDREVTDSASQMNVILDTATKLVEMTKPAANATPAVDPWAAAERILNMRSNNPMVEILEKQITALSIEMGEQRKENARLQQQFFEDRIKSLESKLNAAPEKKSGGIIDQAKELAELLGITPGDALKRFMGGSAETVM